MEENEIIREELPIPAPENVPETVTGEISAENAAEDIVPEIASEPEKSIRTGVYMTCDTSPSDDLLRRSFGLK